MVKTRKQSKTIILKLEEFTSMLESECQILRSTAAHYFRRLFSMDREFTNVPTDSPFYPRIATEIMRILNDENLPCDSKVDATWVLTNMICISQELNHLYVRLDCIDVLVRQIGMRNKPLVEQSLWALGNVAADCSECRARCRSNGIFKILAQSLAKHQEMSRSELKSVIWCLNYLTMNGRIDIAIPIARPLINNLAGLLIDRHGEPSEFAAKILWTLANLADDVGQLSKIDLILNYPALVDNAMLFFKDPNYSKLHAPSLRLIGNVAVGSDTQTDRLIARPMFQEVLTAAMKGTDHRGEIAWICSNLCAGLPRHLDYLLQNEHFYNWVVEGVHSREKRVKKESLWVIANMLATADELQLDYLVKQGVLHYIPRLLEADDLRLNEKALSGAIAILSEFPWQYNLFCELDIMRIIERELMIDDTFPLFIQPKRTLEGILENLKQHQRKRPSNQDEYEYVVYSTVDVDFS